MEGRREGGCPTPWRGLHAFRHDVHPPCAPHPIGTKPSRLIRPFCPQTSSTIQDVTLTSMVFADGAGVSFSISRSGRPRQRVDPCVPLYVCAQAHQLGCASALVKLGFCSRNMRGRIR